MTDNPKVTERGQHAITFLSALNLFKSSPWLAKNNICLPDSKVTCQATCEGGWRGGQSVPGGNYLSGWMFRVSVSIDWESSLYFPLIDSHVKSERVGLPAQATLRKANRKA